MKYQLFSSGNNIAYKLKRSRRCRRLKLAVHCDGEVIVTVPWCYSFNVAHEFVKEKSSWIKEKVDYFKSKNPILATKNKEDYERYREVALTLVKERLEYFNQFYGFSYRRISIRDPKTRWGSCSQRGNLNFSYKIVFLPKEFQDYLVVHELCHLKEFNHSLRFWQLVEKSIPNYRKISSQLRKY